MLHFFIMVMPRSELQIHVFCLERIFIHRVQQLLPARAFVVLVWEVQVALCAIGRQHHHTDYTTRASVPLDGLSERALDELDALLLCHALLPVGVAVSVDVC